MILRSLLILLIFLLAATAYLETVPLFWWDEGWTSSVARNWVEFGHYGRLLMGEKAPAGLEAAFPVTGAVALAFKFFGIGLFQARLAIVIYMAGALALLLYLARRFYGSRIACATLFVLLLMPGNRWTHFLFMGRQVLAEVPALFFLLAGYTCFLWVGERSRTFLLASILFWSIAIITKAQVLPFFVLSLGVPLAIAVFIRRWTIAGMLAAALFGSVLLSYSWQFLLTQYVMASRSSVSGLHEAVALVHEPFRRLISIWNTLYVGLTCVLGLGWAVGDGHVGTKIKRSFATHNGVVKLSYFILAASWFAWWEFASIGWFRYLFPPTFLASIFASAMLHEWTQGFRFREALRATATDLTQLRFRPLNLRVLAVLVLVFWASVRTVVDLTDSLARDTNGPFFETVNYLHTNTPSDAVIETYESELFLVLRRRYHYPPDQVHVELIRREDLYEPVKINYDPLSADPDYLVLGPFAELSKCYDAVLRSGAFKLVQVFGPYQIYKRVRETDRAQGRP
jgi:hypothetical protein